MNDRDDDGEGLLRVVQRRLGWAVRDRFPDRRVVREVQGVRLTLPWSHRLPDYARGDSPYGQNLVDLARGLAGDGDLVVLDIGANVGDSALQIAEATDAVVVCVEGDPYYLDFLVINTGGSPRLPIVSALLVPEAGGAPTAVRAVRSRGTTRFVHEAEGQSWPTVTPADVRRDHPITSRLRLVKSDTDGHDVAIIPSVAREWQDTRPVLFFEYDLHLSRLAGHDARMVWPALEGLGYTRAAVWGNGGHPLGQLPVSAMPDASSLLVPPLRGRRAPSYWDVAVVHRDDLPALAVIDALVPGRLSLPGADQP